MKPNFIIRFLFLTLFFNSVFIPAQKQNVDDLSLYFKNLPFKMAVLKVPKFSSRVFNVEKYGAVGNGLIKNTRAIQKAIDECSNAGGGKVVIPQGIWLTGPIVLKNNVNLHLKSGALLQFSREFNDYPLRDGFYEGTAQLRCQSPISSYKANNIAITGNGIIDGAGDAWRYVKKSKMTGAQWKELLNSGGVVDKSGNNWWPSQAALDVANHLADAAKTKLTPSEEIMRKGPEFFRPVMVNLVYSKNILLDGPTFQNSPAWNLHPLMSENIIVRNITVRNPWYSQNGDGIDVESCKNVLIYSCKFDVGDDALCMKSGKDKEGRERGIPTENIIITDCVVYHGHGGFTIGSEMSGSVRNIKVSNCQFIGTDIGLRFKSTRGRGGVVENIFIENIYMKDIPTEAIGFNMFYGGFAPGDDKAASDNSKQAVAVPVSDETPQFRKIYMDNIYCIGAKNALILQGLPEMSIKEIEIKNSTLYADNPVFIYDAEKIRISNTIINAKSGTPFTISQSNNVLIENVECNLPSENYISVEGMKSENIILKGKNAELFASKTKIASDISAAAVRVEK